MMCNEAADLVLEDVRAPGLDEHLAGCTRCRELRGAHRSALALRTLPIDLPRPRAPSPRSMWQSPVLRVAVASMVVLVALVALLPSGIDPSSANAIPNAAGRADIAALEMPNVAISDDALESLLVEVDSYTRDDALAEDALLSAFGELSDLLTPTSATPVRTVDRPRGLGEERP